MTRSNNSFMAGISPKARTSLNDFPTPPWAVRALFERTPFRPHRARAWEPACGRGYMAKVMSEYYPGGVMATDIHDYGYGARRDFLTNKDYDYDKMDIITNPPFNLAEEFVLHALKHARWQTPMGAVAIFQRIAFLESISRYENLFTRFPLTYFCPFVERVPIAEGRLIQKATPASYAWFVWHPYYGEGDCKVHWISPCRKEIERPEDYEQ